MTTSPPAADGDDEVLNTIHLLLGSSIRVTMTDGRVVRGKFTCLDRLGNIILEDVVEQRWLTYNDASTQMVRNGNTTKKTNYSNDSNSNNNIQHTNDEDGTCRWSTERSLTKAVILGRKVTKVEITTAQWEARMGNL